MESKKIRYKGVEYHSKKELAIAYGLKPQTFITRLNRGMELEEALTTPTKQFKSYRGESSSIIFHNRQFKSLGEIADNYGVDKSIFLKICQRCRESEGLDYCLEVAMKKRGITYKGKHYSNYVELSADYGLLKDTLMQRLYLGWSLHDALTTEVRKRVMKKSYTIRGITYTSKSEACSSLGLDPCLVTRTCNYLGLSWGETAEFLLNFIEKLGGKRPNIVSFIPVVIYNGKWIRDNKEFCKECNVDYVAFRDFKYTCPSSNTLEAMKDYTSRKEYVYHYRGKTYNKGTIEKIKGVGHGTKAEVLLKDKEITRTCELKEKGHTFKPTDSCIYVKDRYISELNKAKKIQSS